MLGLGWLEPSSLYRSCLRDSPAAFEPARWKLLMPVTSSRRLILSSLRSSDDRFVNVVADIYEEIFIALPAWSGSCL